MSGLTNQKGTPIKVSEEVIAVCAANAAIRTEGVADLAGGISNLISKNLLGKELASKGIKATQTKDGVEVDVNIIVKFGSRIPALAWDIQEHVRDEIIEMTGLNVAAVNINVQGVELPVEETNE
ncbi:MAG: Asp23/Gls24 family envelope stress response protein [Eubacterium sp.]|nr:Asp23/Gls24 family envelope stress response protein [Candidatus Colimonas fimequi]